MEKVYLKHPKLGESYEAYEKNIAHVYDSNALNPKRFSVNNFYSNFNIILSGNNASIENINNNVDGVPQSKLAKFTVPTTHKQNDVRKVELKFINNEIENQ